MSIPFKSEGRFVQKIEATPLVEVRLASTETGIWCKLEFLNPSGSTKDRIARYMVEKAWRNGRIEAGGTVIEASSGSTSIALAMTCAQMGLEFIAVMPEGVSRERQLMIRAYGGEVILVPPDEGIHGALRKAEEIAGETGAYYTRQFENPDNAEAHRVWTGQEILKQIPGGTVNGIVSGVGTGGTIVGLYSAFEEAGCEITPFAARPVRGSALQELECCSFSPCVPGVVEESVSKLYRDADLNGLIEIDIGDDL
ncbi:MAG: cysteine synthase, partial [Planctomycetes bacterium]|nr:cysteine synthase [Planctomycetota bacterium]